MLIPPAASQWRGTRGRPGRRLEHRCQSNLIVLALVITLTVHPAKALSWYHLEVNALVAILGVDQMREPDGVELGGVMLARCHAASALYTHLLRDHTVEIHKGRRHPVEFMVS